MWLVTYSGGRQVDFLRFNNQMWPVTEFYAASKFFYSVIDTSQTWENNTKNKMSDVRHYESPEVYWQCRMSSLKPHIDEYNDSDNSQSDYDSAMQKYIVKLEEFREINKPWYKTRALMLEDMEGFVNHIREETGAQSSYPADGYCITRSADNIYDVNNIRL
jgi:hypothetical protein